LKDHHRISSSTGCYMYSTKKKSQQIQKNNKLKKMVENQHTTKCIELIRIRIPYRKIIHVYE
jgi:hypothetical protein